MIIEIRPAKAKVDAVHHRFPAQRAEVSKYFFVHSGRIDKSLP